MGRGNRLAWIANIRGLMIFFVVVFHSTKQYGTGWLYTSLEFLVIPIFFFLSGMLLKTDMAPTVFIRNKAKRILIPYFAYAFLSYGFFIIRKIIKPDFMMGSDPLQLLGGIFYATNVPGWMINVPLWFLPCLFLIQCLLYFYSRFSKKTFILLLAISPVIGYCLDRLIVLPPWSMAQAFSDVAFAGVGYLLSRRLCYSSNKLPIWLSVIAFIFWLTAVLISVQFSLNSIEAALFRYPSSFCAILALIGVFQRVPKISYLVFMSKYSIEILALHTMAFIITTTLLRNLCHIPIHSAIDSLLGILPPTQICLVIAVYLSAGILGPTIATNVFKAVYAQWGNLVALMLQSLNRFGDFNVRSETRQKL